jgi:hypothetical protein
MKHKLKNILKSSVRRVGFPKRFCGGKKYT